jgi:hypothetical protein
MEKMMKMITHLFVITLTVGILTFYQPIQAELLVMKQTEEGFAPLDDSDNENKVKIEEILLKYQWPTSAAFALAPLKDRKKILAETGDLFTPNKPNAEEIWIEQKIQQETGNDTYRVVFFPTTLYELFILIIFDEEKNNPLNTLTAAVKKYRTRAYSGDINLTEIISSSDNPDTVNQKICDTYKESNKFFMGHINSAHDYINQKLTLHLLTLYPELRESKDSLDLSKMLETKVAALTTSFIQKISKAAFQRISLTRLSRGIQRSESVKIIAHFIDSEYGARHLNEVFITRGSSIITIKLDDQERLVAGSTFKVYPNEEPFELVYKKGEIKPYSISFGNSLFAGIVADEGACAYSYLAGTGVYARTAHLSAVGYTLLINKQNYIQNQISQLFFIPSLASITALFASGEYFHVRSKAAIAAKPKGKIRVAGVFSIEDPTGVLLITRDPLEHAALFSRFLADNGRIIQLGDESKLTEEEKLFAKNVMKAQEEAAGYYKGIKGMRPMWETWLPRVRKKIETRKAATTSTQEAQFNE